MYLSELKLWNFRKYSINGDKFESAEPGLSVQFNEGINVLIGENDSGKTAIIDAIRYVLKTHSQEFINIEEKDFFKDINGRADEFKIECTFSGFSYEDAGHFLEWIGFDDNGEYSLKIWLYAKRKDNDIYKKVSAGIANEGAYIEGEARKLLQVIYLKPLRDALSDMTNGQRSRLAQILRNLDAFKKDKEVDGSEKSHALENHYGEYKQKVDSHFEDDVKGKQIKETINEFLKDGFLFRGENRTANLTIEENELTQILKDLNLILEDNKSGLGTLNLLYIAAELLHLKEQLVGLKLTLIEELEAHLHPQYQLRVIDFIEKEAHKYGQFILTTHSTTLASKIKLENLIICQNNKVYPMGYQHTQLEKGDYQFLQRFLDSTKANLFFARGVIIVEGDAENLLIPTIAELIGRPLHEYGVSIVNVGSTAFKRYAKIFLRKNKDGQEYKNEWLDIPVSIVTDLDIPSFEYFNDKKIIDEHGNEKIKEVWLIQKSEISNFEQITEDVEWKNVADKVCSSKSSLLELVTSNKSIKRFPAGIKKKIEDEVENCSCDVTNKLISKLRKRKRSDFNWLLNKQRTRVFVPSKWTLEYELAYSNIRLQLLYAINAAKVLKSNNDKALNKALFNEIKRTANDFFKNCKKRGANRNESAYMIFKPLNEGEVSKAVVSQILAQTIKKTWDSRSLLLRDAHLQYICNAIYHVTEPKGGSNE